MNSMYLVELNDTEIDEVSGGVAWVPIAVGAIFVGGLLVEAYNAYNEEAKAAAKKKPTPPPRI